MSPAATLDPAATRCALPCASASLRATSLNRLAWHLGYTVTQLIEELAARSATVQRYRNALQSAGDRIDVRGVGTAINQKPHSIRTIIDAIEGPQRLKAISRRQDPLIPIFAWSPASSQSCRRQPREGWLRSTVGRAALADPPSVSVARQLGTLSASGQLPVASGGVAIAPLKLGRMGDQGRDCADRARVIRVTSQ